jgi:hypothetical protein
VHRILPALCALALLASSAPAAVLDGRLDPDYGPPLALQSTQTSMGKSNPGFGGPDSTSSSFGSELDGAYGFVAGGALHLFIAGNVLASLGEFDHRAQLHLFVDSRPGGQHQLRGDNADAGYWPDSRLNTLAGLTFDSGFAADWWLDVVVLDGPNPVHAYAAELLDGGGGSGGFLGSAPAAGPGILTGGTNPFGIRLSADDSNSKGVSAGCGGATGAETATRGFEWDIPLAALGNPAGAMRICAFVGGVYNSPGLGDQVLGSAPPGTCFLGPPAGVDFSALAGDQFFVVGESPTVARSSSWGRLKAAYR